MQKHASQRMESTGGVPSRISEWRARGRRLQGSIAIRMLRRVIEALRECGTLRETIDVEQEDDSR